jgi:hypothetical protein
MYSQLRPLKITLVLSMSFLSSGQQSPTNSSANFRSEVREVLVSFNVVRDRYFTPDVKREDVLLLEDGKPRVFSVFEGPGTGHRPPLELVLLFDTTTLPPPESKTRVMNTHWDREATYDFANHWGDHESRAVLEKDGADVRISVYRYDHREMQRLCRSTTDPQTVGNAMHRLLEPIPSGEAIPLTLPLGRETWEAFQTKRHLKPDPKWPGRRDSWTREAIIDTLKDCATSPEKALRVLIVFTEGLNFGVTTTTLEDVTSQAIALGIPVYPIVLDFEQYRGHPYVLVMTANGAESGEATLMVRFGGIGESTGGRAFFPSQLDADLVVEVLNAIRNEGLSRYVLGFQPPSSGQQRTHRLEVKLKSKSSGKLMGGKRTAVY